MAHWLQTVSALLASETIDLRELARTAGGDPKTFYRGANLDGVDICGQDLRGMGFTGLGLAAVRFDKFTRLSAKQMAELNSNPRATRVLASDLLTAKKAKSLRLQATERIREIAQERLFG